MKPAYQLTLTPSLLTIATHLSMLPSIIPSFYRDLSCFRALPDLLWIHIFEHLTRPQDRYHIIQTCRRFYHLGLRVLYGEITFRDISYFESNSSFWTKRGDDMVTAPRSVHFRKPFMLSVEDNSGLISWDPPTTWLDADTIMKAFVFPSDIMDRLTTFSNLGTMIFEGITLPFEFYSFLFLFPELRELALLDCKAPTTDEPVAKRFRFEDLPITTLRIIDCRTHFVKQSTAFSAIESFFVSDDTDIYNILHLATAKNLRHLHIKWNTPTATFFGALARRKVISFASDEPSEFDRHKWAFPLHLETLRILSLTKWEWSVLRESSRRMQRRTQTTPLNSVLKACQGTLRTLGIEGHVFSVFHPLRRARMTKLEEYDGPLEFFKSVWTPKGQLKKFRIVDTCYSPLDGRRDGSSWSTFCKVFGEARMKRNQEHVTSLEVKVNVWEDRVIKDIASIFKGLEELKIEVVEGFPDKTILQSMARRDLSNLTSLSTFELFNSGPVRVPSIPPPPFALVSSSSTSPSDADDQVVCQLLSAWEPYLPHFLRDIRLTPTSIWRRGHKDDTWCKRMLDLEEAGYINPKLKTDDEIDVPAMLMPDTIHTNDTDMADYHPGPELDSMLHVMIETIGGYVSDDAHTLNWGMMGVGLDGDVFIENVD